MTVMVLVYLVALGIAIASLFIPTRPWILAISVILLSLAGLLEGKI